MYFTLQLPTTLFNKLYLFKNLEKRHQSGYSFLYSFNYLKKNKQKENFLVFQIATRFTVLVGRWFRYVCVVLFFQTQLL